jgi:hypothetical protein
MKKWVDGTVSSVTIDLRNYAPGSSLPDLEEGNTRFWDEFPKENGFTVLCEWGTVRKGKPFVKYASCHDLRRSFGERWAARVMPIGILSLQLD